MPTGTDMSRTRRSTIVEPLFTAPEVAHILGVHPNYVWAEAKAGRIPSISIGRNRRFRGEDIERWLEENTRRAA
jgi:excisionase family DNA binding protein